MTRIYTDSFVIIAAVMCYRGVAVGCFGAGAAVKLEGCVSCHGQIEPMHKYGTTETLEKLKDGKDAVGLSCTACHGGNPVARDQRGGTCEAEVSG